MGPLSEKTRAAMQQSTGRVLKIRHSTVLPPGPPGAGATTPILLPTFSATSATFPAAFPAVRAASPAGRAGGNGR